MGSKREPRRGRFLGRGGFAVDGVCADRIIVNPLCGFVRAQRNDRWIFGEVVVEVRSSAFVDKTIVLQWPAKRQKTLFHIVNGSRKTLSSEQALEFEDKSTGTKLSIWHRWDKHQHGNGLVLTFTGESGDWSMTIAPCPGTRNIGRGSRIDSAHSDFIEIKTGKATLEIHPDSPCGAAPRDLPRMIR